MGLSLQRASGQGGITSSHHECSARGEAFFCLVRGLWLNSRAELGKPLESDLCSMLTPSWLTGKAELFQEELFTSPSIEDSLFAWIQAGMDQPVMRRVIHTH